MGPKAPRSTVLTPEEEAIAVAFRKHTLLPLDDCLYALQTTIPHLTRSSLHRLFQRHDVSRLPEIEGDKASKKPFKVYPIGYFHLDIAEVHTEEGKLHLFVAVDRTSKLAFARLYDAANRKTASHFLEALVATIPYKIHTVLTDNGVQFCYPAQPAQRPDRAVHDPHVRHALPRERHPNTASLNRTIPGLTARSNA